jgi:hypothetical protein
MLHFLVDNKLLGSVEMRNSRKRAILIAAIILLIVVLALLYWWNGRNSTSDSLSPEEAIVQSTSDINATYDVVVVGTDPEGVMAAVSAARNGLHTLLVDSKNREILGGLFTLGWLNSLDMNRLPGSQHDYYNKGLFKEWYDQVEGDSFDVTTAAVIFNRMVKAEKNIDVLMNLESIEPVVDAAGDITVVTGVRLISQDGSELKVRARAVIDATQDADLAAAAGAGFTFGREDIGEDKLLMAVTPVFKLTNVTPEVWQNIKDRLNGDYSTGTGANDWSAWGYAQMWNYPSSNPEKLRSRGLNFGRQNDDTVLVNSIQVFGVNPFDAASREEAYEAARTELPLMLKYIKKTFPELKELELGPMAPELYIRETRHLIGEYRLTMIDLLEQRDHWDRIAFGSYPVDIQSTSSDKRDRGVVVMNPRQYAVPFRCLIPQKVDGLLVVGRSASFDTLPHGSARVVTLGMATGESAGAAVKIAIEEEITLRALSESRILVKKLQDRLTDQGMVLEPKTVKRPDYMEHPAYEGLKAAVSMGIALGSYGNDFELDANSNPQRMVNNVKGMAKVFKSSFPFDVKAALEGMTEPEKQTLTLGQAAFTIMSALDQGVVRETAVEKLKISGLVSEETLQLIIDPNKLTNGDVYMLLKDAIAAKAGVVYE